ncbi:MAG: class I SAM-dependent methyltransferase [Lachnospiraceae bacterium]|nr:class I SAM-dependent methyltransferase [Lachnospiraceae bacterium]
MNIYSFLSVGYDLLDRIWLSEKGNDPRRVIESILPNEKCKVLDMCCGTFTNGLSIARKNPNNLVVGLDRSKPMLFEGKRKVIKEGLKNVRLLSRDATDTGLKDESFDYIIIGLVLHECDPDLINRILKEAFRLLKKDGSLIILEWEKQKNIRKIVKYAPLYFAEVMCNPGYFTKFYKADKKKLFKKYGFETDLSISCNYTVVMKLKKRLEA